MIYEAEDDDESSLLTKTWVGFRTSRISDFFYSPQAILKNKGGCIFPASMFPEIFISNCKSISPTYYRAFEGSRVSSCWSSDSFQRHLSRT